MYLLDIKSYLSEHHIAPIGVQDLTIRAPDLTIGAQDQGTRFNHQDVNINCRGTNIH